MLGTQGKLRILLHAIIDEITLDLLLASRMICLENFSIHAELAELEQLRFFWQLQQSQFSLNFLFFQLWPDNTSVQWDRMIAGGRCLICSLSIIIRDQQIF